jgi:hypothetical protein
MEILKAKDIAKILNMSVKFVYIHYHELGGFKIGGSVMFTREGFENAIQRAEETQERQNRDQLAWSGKRERISLSSKVPNSERSSRVGAGNKKTAKKIIQPTSQYQSRHGLN